ncbi:MAG: translation initiation factor IF-3 [Gammaproteobacteria bacterium]|nr:translation initiation factor IF-3 [Gammaproteobacteria bacterium]MDH5630585.1 translation initiation factor IF-3 [Gammaproteobacteria bacterium]
MGQKEQRANINEEITAQTVRLIGSSGEAIGVVSIAEAIQTAEAESLDLVEISPNAEPPVCKIMNYGKFIFEQKKAKAAAKKKQTIVHVKEIKFRPGTDIGDYNVKVRKLQEFLEDGDKTKVTVRFRGREMAHRDLGMELLKRVELDLAEVSDVESHPKLEGRQMMMVLAPKKKK